jgi:uncharacterized protein
MDSRPSKELGLRLLVLQPTPFCNIDCAYCYLSGRQSKAAMSLETLDQVCTLVFESGLIGLGLDVAWHGGEPLVVPLKWYEDAFELMENRRPAALELKHRFQTNGLLVDGAWARFFARTRARVGLSIDGPAELHDSNRRTRRGGGTHEGAMRALRILQAEGVTCHVITVLTERALDAPEELFDFYVSNGIAEVGFNIEEIEGEHATSSLAGAEAERRFRSFIKQFFDLVWKSPGVLKVRELESMLGMLLLNEPVVDEQNVPFAIVSVSVDGAISTFSPELLGAQHHRFDSFAFGRLGSHLLPDIANEPMFLAIDNEIRAGVRTCEHDCRYFRWCGGGAPANKLFEMGRFDARETTHCRLTRKAILDDVLERLEAVVAESRKGNNETSMHFNLHKHRIVEHDDASPVSEP